MDNVKVVVLKVTGKKTIVFTETGDFIKITTPNPVPVKGQVIEINSRCRIISNPGNLFRHVAVAAALLLIPILALIHPLVWPPGGAVAAVEMNTGYGLNLHVDRDGRIAAVRGTGSISDYVVEELSLKGLDIYQAIRLIVEDAGQKGNFDHEQSIIMVSVVPVGEGSSEPVDPEKIRGIIREELVKQNASSTVMVARSSRDAGSRAEDLGMTVNNYLVYERCIRGGLDVNADVFRGRTVLEAINEANLSLAKLFPGELMEINVQGGDAESEVIVYTNPALETAVVSEMQETRRIQPGSRGGMARDSARDNHNSMTVRGAG